jgi:hypothetical protein
MVGERDGYRFNVVYHGHVERKREIGADIGHQGEDIM